jgi:hypothetical protein
MDWLIGTWPVLLIFLAAFAALGGGVFCACGPCVTEKMIEKLP